jgi:hypothetical protein
MRGSLFTVLLGVGVLVFAVWVGVLLVDEQLRQITEFCLAHPNSTLNGDLVVNCSEWLKK